MEEFRTRVDKLNLTIDIGDLIECENVVSDLAIAACIVLFYAQIELLD